MLGTTLGHYKILDRLGAGGMGVVWLAEDLKLGRRVALKTLHERLPAGDERSVRFEREARAVASLSHPNIVTLHSVEEVDGVRFLTMEYVDGQPLGAKIGPGGLPPTELLRIGAEIADALTAAHARGIVHRDLKPANVLLGKDGRVRVVDFGVARTVSTNDIETGAPFHDKSLTRDGIAIGTLNYMSPEQLAARSIDTRSDLFSLGVLLFEMATGELPFQGDSAALVASAILRDPPRRLEGKLAKLPPQVVDLIDALLAKQPDDRPASATEVRQRLRSALRLIASETEGFDLASVPPASNRARAAGSSAAVPDGAPAPTATNGSRRPLLVAIGALAAIGALVATVLLVRAPQAPSADRSQAPVAPAVVRATPSIAVLPFRSFSNDPDYFVDGMTDGLIDSLAKVGGLRVISRQSAMHFKGSSKLLAQVARELGVDYLVEGSLTRQGERIQVRAKLLRPDPEEQIWTESYDRPVSDFRAIEVEVATSIARQVKVALTPEESTRLAAGGVVDPGAYDAYLRGRYLTNERSADALQRAIASFEEAIEAAPDFAPAHAALADALSILARVRADAPELQKSGRSAAERALALDPDSVEAHLARGRLDLYADWNWQSAEREVRRALELNPSHSEAHLLLWNLETAHGRIESARVEIQRALDLDPLSVQNSYYLGIQEIWERDLDAARAQFERTLQRAPEYGPALMSLWGVEAMSGNDEAAFGAFRRALPRLGYADLLPAIEVAWRQGGFRAAMREAAREFAAVRNGRPRWIDAVPYAAVFGGDGATALDYLEKAAALRAPTLIWIRANPAWDPIASEPRFVAIIERMGLADSPPR